MTYTKDISEQNKKRKKIPVKKILLGVGFLLLAVNLYGWTQQRDFYETPKEILFSRNIEVLEEKIEICISGLQNADYTINYTFQCDSTGKQIPCLLNANQFYPRSDYQIWVNGHEMETITEMEISTSSLLEKADSIAQFFNPEITNSCHLTFIETEIQQGIHSLTVRYSLRPNVNYNDLIKRYTYFYDFHPVIHWPSFPGVTITINTTQTNIPFTLIHSGDTLPMQTTRYTYQYAEAPAIAPLRITYEPALHPIPKFLSKHQFHWLMWKVLSLLIAHLYLIRRYRKKNPNTFFPPVVYLGGILVPALACYFTLISFYSIDILIGKHATWEHGMLNFFTFASYCFVTPVYLALCFLFDFCMKKYWQHKKESHTL